MELKSWSKNIPTLNYYTIIPAFIHSAHVSWNHMKLYHNSHLFLYKCDLIICHSVCAQTCSHVQTCRLFSESSLPSSLMVTYVLVWNSLNTLTKSAQFSSSHTEYHCLLWWSSSFHQLPADFHLTVARESDLGPFRIWTATLTWQLMSQQV